MEREEIKRLLTDAREENCFGWQLVGVGVYSYNGDLQSYITWRGQGIDEIVYNNKYDDIIDVFNKKKIEES